MDDFITLQEYKEYKKLTKNDDDVKLGIIVNAVNSLIKAYIGRGVVLDPDTPIVEYITLDYDTDVIFPESWPINSVVSVTEVPYGYNYDSTIHLPLEADVDYLISDNDRIYKVGGTWKTGPKAIRLEYTAGYDTVPDEIKLAAVELVNYYYKEQFLQARTTGNTTITQLVPNQSTMPPHVKLILDNYING